MLQEQKNDHLNLLYIENKNSQIILKIKEKQQKSKYEGCNYARIRLGNLKCTTQMDKLNKSFKENNSRCYQYKGDTKITVGVLGMVDDTLLPAECV